MHTLSEENYLKALYKLGFESLDDGFVSNQAVCDHLHVKASSVTVMLKQLADKDLLQYERYRGAKLKAQAQFLALMVIRKHRLWEVFLVDKLGFGWQEVHEIAEQLEHIQHGDLINRLDDLLGHPLFDPHGDPIPNRLGEMPLVAKTQLSALTIGSTARVAGVSDHSESLLQQIDRLGLRINDSISVVEIAPFDLSLLVSINQLPPVFVSKLVADHIYIVANP